MSFRNQVFAGERRRPAQNCDSAGCFQAFGGDCGTQVRPAVVCSRHHASAVSTVCVLLSRGHKESSPEVLDIGVRHGHLSRVLRLCRRIGFWRQCHLQIRFVPGGGVAQHKIAIVSGAWRRLRYSFQAGSSFRSYFRDHWMDGFMFALEAVLDRCSLHKE